MGYWGSMESIHVHIADQQCAGQAGVRRPTPEGDTGQR